MKAMVLEGVRDYNLRDVPMPVCPPHGVLIKVMANGICRSDWHKWRGEYPNQKFPMILGHEMSGVVEQVGSQVTRFKVGDRIMVPVGGSEGTCDWCKAGHSNLCETYLVPGIGYNGGFAEYVAVPYADRNVEHLPDNVSFEVGAILSCRTITGYRGVIETGDIRLGEYVAVYGCGGVGLAAVMTAHKCGAFVIAVDIKDEALELAKTLGADYIINAKNVNPVDEILSITKGNGVEAAVEAMGSYDTVNNALASLAKCGRLIQLGVTSAGPEGYVGVPIFNIVNKEKRILGSLSSPIQNYKRYLEVIGAGVVDPSPIITKTVCLSEVVDVFEAMDRDDIVGSYVVNDFTR